MEINPFITTTDDKLFALDAKITFDDNALFRHADIKALRDIAEEDPLEVEASKYALNYIKLDGIDCVHGERRGPGHGDDGHYSVRGRQPRRIFWMWAAARPRSRLSMRSRFCFRMRM